MKRLLCITLALALLVPAGAQNPKQQASRQQARKERLEKDIAVLDQQLKANSKKRNGADTALKLTRRKIKARRQLLAESELLIARMDRDIVAKNHRIDSLELRLSTMRTHYAKLVRTAYRNRDSRIWYMYILSSGGLGQGFRRYGYLKSMAGRMNAEAGQILALKDTLEAEKARAEKLRAAAAEVRDKRAEDIRHLKADEDSSTRLIASLQKEKKEYQKQLADKRRQVEALSREMSRMVNKSASRPKTEVDAKLDAEFAANMGKLPWPADGPVVDSFGEHYHPVYKNVKMPFNNGVNIAVPKNCAVKAVFDGTVRQIVVMPGYNQCVLVQHGGFFTFYCKLAEVGVKAGDKLRTGQVIGRVDTIAGETQLHFELWEGKTPRNPELWLK